MKNTMAKIATMPASIALTAFAADLKATSKDVDQARLYLQQTQTGGVGATKGLSPAQWNFKPTADRWSIAEIVEHMVLAQEFMLGTVQEQFTKTPAAEDRDSKAVDAMILNQLPDRTTEFHAPGFLEPTGRWTPSAAMDRLRKNFAQLSAILDAPDLRGHAADAPLLKVLSKGEYNTMDGFQWILTAAAHTERHTKQILEARADDNLPGK
jgi:DinB superfamily